MVYYLQTFNKLHHSKKILRNMRAVKDHLDEVISLSKRKLKDKDIEMSSHLIKIDTDKMPEYEKIFHITYKYGTPHYDRKSEYRMKKNKSDTDKDSEENEECVDNEVKFVKEKLRHYLSLRNIDINKIAI